MNRKKWIAVTISFLFFLSLLVPSCALSSNAPPYQVTGPVISDLNARLSSPPYQIVDLVLDGPAGSRDPEGDAVTYTYQVVSGQADFDKLGHFTLDQAGLSLAIGSYLSYSFTIQIRVDAQDSAGNTVEGSVLSLNFVFSGS